MSEQKEILPVELEVLGVESDDIKLKLELAPEDYSCIYEMSLFKKNYDKKTEKWLDDPETNERYEESLTKIGGEPVEGSKLELYVNDDSGKAYIDPPKPFVKTEKPNAKDDGKLWLGAVIVDVRDSDKGREVIVKYKDVLYSFAFTTGMWVKSKEKFILNKAREVKAKEKFKKVFEGVGNVEWDSYEPIFGLKVNLTVKKNALDPNSDKGWLQVATVDEVEYDQTVIQERNAKQTNSLNISDDDIPF